MHRRILSSSPSCNYPVKPQSISRQGRMSPGGKVAPTEGHWSDDVLPLAAVVRLSLPGILLLLSDARALVVRGDESKMLCPKESEPCFSPLIGEFSSDSQSLLFFNRFPLRLSGSESASVAFDEKLLMNTVINLLNFMTWKL